LLKEGIPFPFAGFDTPGDSPTDSFGGSICFDAASCWVVFGDFAIPSVFGA
tara:strand:- start:742 stop:894 length:153 start_codon:yes stop_codon:yes gene_type:complete